MRQLVPLFVFSACAEPEPLDGVAPCGSGAASGLEVGDCAPDFTLPDRGGQAFTLSSQRGKVALVDISALW